MLEVFKIINEFTDIDTKRIFELNLTPVQEDTSQSYDTTADKMHATIFTASNQAMEHHTKRLCQCTNSKQFQNKI